MNSFTHKKINLPLGSVWLMNAISEYKGKQELFSRQAPQLLKTLVEMALIQSVESSNRIEGVTVDKNRLKPLIIGHARPRDRSEEEIAGYRQALDLIHKKHTSLDISPKVILEFHRICRGGVGDAGEWKKKDNEIIRIKPDGSAEVIYKALSADKTPKAIEQLCLLYSHSLEQLKVPPLYAIACLILDFLCIHPFRDGNGRVSRLLTLLALYQQGYNVGKFISLERIVEQTKETYYESLNKSSQGWHTRKHDATFWYNYFFGLVLSAYKEFEGRANSTKPGRGAKTEIVEKAIDAQVGEFSMTDIMKTCPGISRPMIRVILERSRDQGLVKVSGTGRGARWRKT